MQGHDILKKNPKHQQVERPAVHESDCFKMVHAMHFIKQQDFLGGVEIQVGQKKG